MNFLKFVGTVAVSALLIDFILTLAPAAGAPQGAHQEKRISSLIKKMTLDEKIGMVGLLKSRDGYENVNQGVSRLGIPRLILQDGPAGVAAGFREVTQLPAPIALAASWDRSIARGYGQIQGDESWAKGIEVAQGPDVNIARAPLNGRTFEAYGEDPYLTSQLAVANINGIQSQGPMANVKHFVANNQETKRRSINEMIGARALREIYFPAFKAAVKEGHVGSMMCAYNQINGRYSCQNPQLLSQVFERQWGFKGFIRSDFGAVRSTVKAFNAGMDQAKPKEDADGKLKQAVKRGQVSMTRINDAVRRTLREMFRFGLVKNPPTGHPDAKASSPKHVAFARRVSEQGTVLLKNKSNILPLRSSNIDSIAVIGSDAASDALTAGGGSSYVIPSHIVTPLQGIKKRTDQDINVHYVQGDEPYGSLPVVQSRFLTPPSANGHGMRGEYYANNHFSGSPAFTRVDSTIDFSDSHEPADKNLDKHWSARWRGTLTPAKSGVYRFSLAADGMSKLYVDGKLVINDKVYSYQGLRTLTGKITLTADHPVKIRVEYVHNEKGRLKQARGLIKLGWLPPGSTSPSVKKAVEVARKSDVAVVFAGYFASEGYDIQSLRLPGVQNQLIEAVAKTNANTIVVLNTGGPVTMPWINKVKGVIEAWYPGQEDGNSIAAVLFGDVDPSGKLPITFARHPQDYPAKSKRQYPGVNGIAHYSEGIFVGYRHFDQQGIKPLFPFGYGLSYTTFKLTDLVVAPKQFDPAHGQDKVKVHVKVANTGKRAGAEVVQVYVGMPKSVGEPPKQLKGFAKIQLKPGETKQASFTLGARDMSYWNTHTHEWVVPKGRYRIMIGTSSRDIVLSKVLHKGE